MSTNTDPLFRALECDLAAAGYTLARRASSHWIYRHGEANATLTIVSHGHRRSHTEQQYRDLRRKLAPRSSA